MSKIPFTKLAASPEQLLAKWTSQGLTLSEAETPQALFRRDVDFCSGVFLMTRTGLFKELGGFDEAFAPAYYEEVDYCMRLWEHGARVVYDPWIVVDHYEYGSAGSSRPITRPNSRSKLKFGWLGSSSLEINNGSPFGILVDDIFQIAISILRAQL